MSSTKVDNDSAEITDKFPNKLLIDFIYIYINEPMPFAIMLLMIFKTVFPYHCDPSFHSLAALLAHSINEGKKKNIITKLFSKARQTINSG
jgi:hypothetical protein